MSSSELAPDPPAPGVPPPQEDSSYDTNMAKRSRSSQADRYRLRVTAGPSYDTKTHQTIKVNTPDTYTIENDHIVLTLQVRIRNYTGLPSDSPETSDYFQHPEHKSDQYSINFTFIPKKDIPGPDLVFGNDFDRPIRDRLPPGFSAALRVVKWWIDPGLDGDPYADKPYLYGPALSSWNVLHIGDRIEGKGRSGEEKIHEKVVTEGGTESGQEVRRGKGIPGEAAARKKFFLTAANLADFTFEAARLYQSDFGNPYLDFNDFSLQLPGWGNLNVIKYVDSKTHELRYTLKNKSTDEVYCVVLFTLLFGDELKEAEEQERQEKQKTAPSQRDAEKVGADIEVEPAPTEDDVD